MTSSTKTYGFIAPIITSDQYVFGGGNIEKGLPLTLNADWLGYLPEKEIQKNKHFDTNACFIYGTLNMLEMVLRKLGEDKNFSERFQAFYSDYTPNGGNPHKVLESIRKQGALDEAKLPFTNDITSDTYILQAMPKSLQREAQKLLNKYSIKHDWVITPAIRHKDKLDKLRQTIAYSPVGVSVSAWKERDGRFYKEIGEPDNHWVVLVKINADGSYVIYDSYDRVLKTLEPGYDFQYAKRIYVTKKVKKDNWLVELFKHLFISPQY